MRFAMISLLALAGCEATINSVPDDFLPGAGGQTLVIGRVDGGTEGVIPVATIDFFDQLLPITLTVKNEATGEVSTIVCDRPGGSDAWFFVALPPGPYSVLRVRKGQARDVNGQHVDAFFERDFRPSAFGMFAGSGRGRTSVDDSAGREPKFGVGHEPVIYVGTLEIGQERQFRAAGWYFLGFAVAEGRGDWYPEFHYQRGWELKDEYDDALKLLRARYPKITQEVVRSLMFESEAVAPVP